MQLGLLNGTTPPGCDCPQCFNCKNDVDSCANFGKCIGATGDCACPLGFGGKDCASPLCGGLNLSNSQRRFPDKKVCSCNEGWTGENCNVCQKDSFCRDIVPAADSVTCMKSFVSPLFKNYATCVLTNEKLSNVLGEKKMGVTFSCDRSSMTCTTEFWLGEEQSFACQMSKCMFPEQGNSFECEVASCKCISKRYLCDPETLDITPLINNMVRGPTAIKCDARPHGVPANSTEPMLKCGFTEETMSNLLQDTYGDGVFHLDCKVGECIDSLLLPPERVIPDTSHFFGPGYVFALVCALLFLWLLYFFLSVCHRAIFRPPPICHDEDTARLISSGSPSSPRLHADSDDKNAGDDGDSFSNYANTLADAARHHTRPSAVLAFKDVFYTVPVRRRDGRLHDTPILTAVHGLAMPGKVLAIMGASGAGKSSLLDVLAARQKPGAISGDIYVSGHRLSRSYMKSVVGYVDQEDILIPTLTVQEMILYSALLRLPTAMPLEEKYRRVVQTMSELDIVSLANKLIGSSTKRGISGGEKRRVSIACEMVTAPSILLLDEPTSGLDSCNALNVVECIHKLARDYNHTIVLTIHQPRNNIFSLFDDLIVLSKGHVVYSGPADHAAGHFEKLGFVCPPGYNIADYFIDLSVSDSKNSLRHSFVRRSSSSLSLDSESSDDHVAKAPLLNNAPSHNSRSLHHERDENLASRYVTSETFAIIQARISDAIVPAAESPDEERVLLVGARKQPSMGFQISVLAERTFINTVRNPYLLLSHYIVAIVAGCICSFMFYGLDNRLSGLQNRLGVFFFSCSMFAFSSLSLLHQFSAERRLFIRERANRYYQPLTYFICKIMFDIVPLCVVPPVIFGSMIYYTVGLLPTVTAYFKFLLVLVIYDVLTAMTCFAISLSVHDFAVASLLSSLYMLFSMLFSGILLNKNTTPSHMNIVRHFSFFSYALEALTVNEARDMLIIDKKYEHEVKIPAAALLTTLGLDVNAYWSCVTNLSVSLLIVFLISFLLLQFKARERR